MRLVAALLVFLFVSSFVATLTVYTDPGYSEDLQILFLSSSSHVFRLHMKGVDQTAADLIGLESRFAGLQSYAMTLTSRTSQNEGELLAFLDLYKPHPIMEDLSGNIVLPGMRVAARGDPASVEGFVRELGNRFQINFAMIGDDIFFGQPSLQETVASIIWDAVPTQGLAGLMSRDEFLKLDFARITLVFDRSVKTREVILTGFRKAPMFPGPYRLSTTFPQLERQSVNASKVAESSTVSLELVGNLVESAQGITFFNSLENFTATARLSLTGAQKLPNFNITLSKLPPRLIATRAIDRGSVGQGRDVEVALTIKNISPSDSIPAQNITIKEDWWIQDFKFVAGDKTEQIVGELKGQSEIKFVYRLSVTSHEAKLVNQEVDRNIVAYGFRVGNSTQKARTTINATPVLVNLEGPAVSVIIRPKVESSLQPWGSVKLLASVTNYGNRSAFEIEVESSKRASLLPKETWNVETEMLPASLSSTEIRRFLKVPWFDGNTVRESFTNSIELLISHTATSLPRATISSLATWKKVDGATEVTLEYTVEVQDPASVSSPDLSVRLGPGLKVVEPRNFTGSEEVYRASTQKFEKTISKFSMVIQLLKPDNILVPPAELSLRFAGITITRLSKMVGAPVSIFIARDLNFKEVFPKFNVTFSVQVTNNGTQPVFGVRITHSDRQLTITKGSETLSLSNLTSVNSPVVLKLNGFLGSPGEYTIAPAKVVFQFAGREHALQTGIEKVRIHEPPKVTISSQSSVGENEPFKVQIMVQNRAPVEISRVNVELARLPSFIQIIEGDDLVSVGPIGPLETKTVELTLRAIAPATLRIPPPGVVFTYSDVLLLGESEGLQVTVREETLFRYGLPVLFAASILVLTGYAVRRSAPIGPASPR